MKEQELIDLGFERVDVTAEESGYENDWYYFTYDFGNGSFSLISNDSAEAGKSRWYVEILEEETIRFDSSSDLKDLIDIVERNTKQ